MAVTSREVFSSILLLLLAFYNPMLATTWTHGNSNNTDLLLNAIQDASPVDGGYLKAKVTVNGNELNVDVPLTGELMSQGLAVKNQLKENEAMLFVFEKRGKHLFWMKDMKFPIDIIWLDSNGKIVHIEENLEPCPLVFVCPSYAPNTDSQYVLETVAGFIPRHNVSVGTDVDFVLVR